MVCLLHASLFCIRFHCPVCPTLDSECRLAQTSFAGHRAVSAREYRNITGTNNNLANPNLGVAPGRKRNPRAHLLSIRRSVFARPQPCDTGMARSMQTTMVTLCAPACSIPPIPTRRCPIRVRSPTSSSRARAGMSLRCCESQLAHSSLLVHSLNTLRYTVRAVVVEMLTCMLICRLSRAGCVGSQSDMHTWFGMWIVSDITDTGPFSPTAPSANIAVPKGDVWFDPTNTGSCSLQFCALRSALRCTSP